jgi:hypothetical protein
MVFTCSHGAQHSAADYMLLPTVWRPGVKSI